MHLLFTPRYAHCVARLPWREVALERLPCGDKVQVSGAPMRELRFAVRTSSLLCNETLSDDVHDDIDGELGMIRSRGATLVTTGQPLME